MDPALLSVRALEAGMIAWALRSEDEFSLFSDKIGDMHFQFEPWKVVWGILMRCYRQNGEFPTEAETKHMVSQIRDMDWDTKTRLHSLVAEAYAAEATKVSGDVIKAWFSRRELHLISEEMSRLSATPERTAESLPSLITRLEDLSTVHGVSSGTTGVDLFQDGTFECIDELIAENYRGDVIPTGFPKVDSILRGGGVRSHLVIYLAPPGVGKSTMALHTALYNVRRGRRVVYFPMDDPMAEIVERVKSHMLRQDASELDWDPDHVKAVLKAERDARYPGDLFLDPVEANKLAPRDFDKRLQSLKRRFYQRDRRNGVPEERCGVIDLVVIDSGDQVRDTTKGEIWERKKLTYEELGAIAMQRGFPIFVTTQPGQDAVGASQLTQRNAGESFGKIKPAKLILGGSQTYAMSHEKRVIEFQHPQVVANLPQMDTVDRDHDRNTEWTPWWCNVIKNNRARSSGGGPVKLVKFPMLVHYPSARMTTDWTVADELMLEDKKTKREEKDAEDRFAPPERQPESSKRSKK